MLSRRSFVSDTYASASKITRLPHPAKLKPRLYESVVSQVRLELASFDDVYASSLSSPKIQLEYDEVNVAKDIYGLMASFPERPALSLSDKSLSHAVLLNHGSFMIDHLTAAAGKNPHFLFSAKFDAPSPLRVRVK